jgi:KDO2-lipid IV(A) lauroyltransferase
VVTDLEYTFRVSPWSSEITYRPGLDALFWKGGHGQGRLDYAAIRVVHVYKVRYLGSRKTYWRCVLRYGLGRKICLQAAHFAGFRRIEDRTPTYIPFVKRLEARIAAANPDANFREGRQSLTFTDAALGSALILIQKSTRVVGLNSATRAISWLMRKIGPRLKGQRIARLNLIAAYPEKSAHEVERILLGMWDNIGRVFVEYSYLDQIWNYIPNRDSQSVVLDRDSRSLFLETSQAQGPALFFGAHLANWELLPWALGSRKGEAAVVYRAQAAAPIERELARQRENSGVTYISANTEAIFQIKAALRRGAFVGIMMDEHFARGVTVNFFGRPCMATPILARMARQFDCPIYGGRIVRLSASRFRFDMVGPIATPRDADGKIDVAATTQVITGVLEGWVRENPEQWLWLQRRWRGTAPALGSTENDHSIEAAERKGV